MKAKLVIGVTGGSGSGKSYFMNRIMDSFGKGEVTWFSLDNYYFPIEKQEKDQNGIENFDRPESLDRKRFHQDLKKLISGESLKIQEYTFNYRNKPPQFITIPSAPVIIVEGIFTLYYEEIQKYLALKIFIDTPEYLMMKRRIIRDAEERGYDLEDVLYRFENHVIPSYEQFILPSKHRADLIVPNHDKFEAALEVILTYIKQFEK